MREQSDYFFVLVLGVVAALMLLGMTALFFMDGTWIGALAGIAVSASVFFLEIWIDNRSAGSRGISISSS